MNALLVLRPAKLWAFNIGHPCPSLAKGELLLLSQAQPTIEGSPPRLSPLPQTPPNPHHPSQSMILLFHNLHFTQNLYKTQHHSKKKQHAPPRTIQKSKFAPSAQPQLFIIHYSLFIIQYSLHHSPQKSGAGSRPLRLIIFCLLLYPLTAQDLRKQRQDRQYSYKLCRMCSYRLQRNIRYPDRRTDADRH